MGFEIEAQDELEFRQIKARELQLDNIDKIEQISNTLNNVDLSTIESNTNDIRTLVFDNLEEQPNLSEIVETLAKISQGISDIKRSQTNLNKKINEIQGQINEGE